MRCPNCGQENPPQAKFCGKCASRLVQPSAPAAPVAYPPPAGDDVSQGLKIGVLIGTLFVPLLGIIMGIIYMREPNQSKQAAGKLWLWVGVGVVAAYCICMVASGLMGELANQ
jgi:hypothetical protein